MHLRLSLRRGEGVGALRRRVCVCMRWVRSVSRRLRWRWRLLLLLLLLVVLLSRLRVCRLVRLLLSLLLCVLRLRRLLRLLAEPLCRVRLLLRCMPQPPIVVRVRRRRAVRLLRRLRPLRRWLLLSGRRAGGVVVRLRGDRGVSGLRIALCVWVRLGMGVRMWVCAGVVLLLVRAHRARR